MPVSGLIPYLRHLLGRPLLEARIKLFWGVPAVSGVANGLFNFLYFFVTNQVAPSQGFMREFKLSSLLDLVGWLQFFQDRSLKLQHPGKYTIKPPKRQPPPGLG